MAAGRGKNSTKKAGSRKPTLAERFARAAPAVKVAYRTHARSEAAKKGAETKRRRAAERAAFERAAKRADKLRRSKAAKKGAKKKRARHRAVLALTAMLNIAARGNSGKEWERIRPEWLDAKWELFDATDGDREAYLDMLDEIAEEADTDWQIAYGPEPEG